MDPKVIAVALLICLALGGCTTTGSLCSAGPFIADQGVNERWTRGEREQLATLNTSGETICGWRAP